MSSDFNIKPVGTPVAAPMVQPAAAEEAVATELPAHQSVAAAEASPRVRHDTQSASDHLSHQVVDNRTSLVVRQFPDQGFLRRRAYARALEQAHADAHALRIDRKI
jgi:hypothetical protein